MSNVPETTPVGETWSLVAPSGSTRNAGTSKITHGQQREDHGRGSGSPNLSPNRSPPPSGSSP